MAKYKSNYEYERDLHVIKWKSLLSMGEVGTGAENLIKMLKAVPYQTESINDAVFLLKLFLEKADEHNANCKLKATEMEQESYKKNNIEDY